MVIRQGVARTHNPTDSKRSENGTTTNFASHGGARHRRYCRSRVRCSGLSDVVSISTQDLPDCCGSSVGRSRGMPVGSVCESDLSVSRLKKHFAAAKWTAGQIRAIQPDWDDVGFYGR